MGDENDRQALGFQSAHDTDEIGDLCFAQRCGRLVHDDETGLHRERAGDLDELLLGDGKVAHLRHGSRLKPIRSAIAFVSCAMRRQLTNSFEPRSRPMNTFSAIVMSSARVNS